MTFTGRSLSPQPRGTLGIGSQQGSFSPALLHPMGAEQIPGSQQNQAFSAIDMAAACLCLADAAWDANAFVRPAAIGWSGRH